MSISDSDRLLKSVMCCAFVVRRFISDLKHSKWSGLVVKSVRKDTIEKTI